MRLLLIRLTETLRIPKNGKGAAVPASVREYVLQLAMYDAC
jgi:hypothetical protein